MRYDYREIKTEKVEVKGISCEFYDMRVKRETIPEGKYLYEVADGDSDGVPARVKPGIMVNFYGTLICDQELPLGEHGVLWLEEGDFIYV